MVDGFLSCWITTTPALVLLILPFMSHLNLPLLPRYTSHTMPTASVTGSVLHTIVGHFCVRHAHRALNHCSDFPIPTTSA